jgi:hypothetical protein
MSMGLVGTEGICRSLVHSSSSIICLKLSHVTKHETITLSETLKQTEPGETDRAKPIEPELGPEHGPGSSSLVGQHMDTA